MKTDGTDEHGSENAWNSLIPSDPSSSVELTMGTELHGLKKGGLIQRRRMEYGSNGYPVLIRVDPF
jgi:hypothetical protein